MRTLQAKLDKLLTSSSIGQREGGNKHRRRPRAKQGQKWQRDGKGRRCQNRGERSLEIQIRKSGKEGSGEKEVTKLLYISHMRWGCSQFSSWQLKDIFPWVANQGQGWMGLWTMRSYAQLEKPRTRFAPLVLQIMTFFRKDTLVLTVCEYRKGNFHVKGVCAFSKGAEFSDINFIYQEWYPGNVNLSTNHTVLEYSSQIGSLLSLLLHICLVSWSSVTRVFCSFVFIWGVFVWFVYLFCLFPSPRFI